MPAKPQQRPPKGLGKAGRAKWREATQEFVFDPLETATLLQICRLTDRLQALEDESATSPPTTKGSRGQVVLSPIIQEIRLTSLALAKLCKSLDLPDPKAPTGRRKGRLQSVHDMTRKAY